MGGGEWLTSIDPFQHLNIAKVYTCAVGEYCVQGNN